MISGTADSEKKTFGQVEVIAFTDRGEALAKEITAGLGENCAWSRSGRQETLADWTEKRFSSADGLVFVGAVGIAVRAIAPFIEDKTRDPAVVVIDEGGGYVIPVLSGHLGGANALAVSLARICGGEPVITTATDIRGVFAVDEWAKRQNCAIIEPEKIRTVSGGILAGKTQFLRSFCNIEGEPPKGCEITEEIESDIALDVRLKGENPIHLVPRICYLGVGCRRGTSCGDLEEAFENLLAKTGIAGEAFAGAASIDLKADEEGLLEFCSAHGWELTTFSAQELENASGEFNSSEFVSEVTGVDNVCERSAVLAGGGRIICEKTAGKGITMAIAMAEYRPDWRWRDE